MKAMIWIVRKELLRFLADRNGAIMTVMLPTVLAILLSIIFAPRDTADSIELLVTDLDGGERVRALVEAIEDDEVLTIEEVSEDEARERIRSGDASVALIIPKGANEVLKPSNLFSGRGIDATLLFDPSSETEADIAIGILTKILMEQVTRGMTDPKTMNEMFTDLKSQVEFIPGDTGVAWLNFMDSGIALSQDSLPATTQDTESAGGLQPPLALQKSEVTADGATSNYNTHAHNFAGMICMFMLFMAMQMATNLVEERKEGSLQRIRLTLANPTLVLLGTGLGTAIVALVGSSIVYAVGLLFFKIPIHGSWTGLICVLLSMCVMIGGFALLLAGLGRTEKQIASFGTFSVLIMSFAGGATLPAFLMPDWLQIIGLVLPTYWTTEGLAGATWRGLPLSHSLTASAVLLAFGVLFSIIGIKTFKWE